MATTRRELLALVSAEGAEAEIPQDHDNFAAGGDALVNLIAWGRAMFALPPKADMCGATRDVCYGPIADIRTYLNQHAARST